MKIVIFLQFSVNSIGRARALAHKRFMYFFLLSFWDVKQMNMVVLQVIKFHSVHKHFVVRLWCYLVLLTFDKNCLRILVSQSTIELQ